VLDVTKLKKDQLAILSQKFDQICGNEISNYANMKNDVTRKEIDNVLTTTLGMPDIADIRNMLAMEPIVCGRMLA
jgi:hypothetical protein